MKKQNFNKNFLQQLKIIADKKRSPFFIYSEYEITKNVETLRTMTKNKVEILYSLKCNSNTTLLKFLLKSGAWCDVASVGELDLCLNHGCLPQKISFTGPGKTEDEIKYALLKKIGYLVVESVDELKIAKKYNINTKILFRISSTKSVQFGIDFESISIEDKKFLLENTNGLHCHLHSQILDADLLIKHFRELLQLSLSLNKKFDVINFGGGFGIPYFKDDNLLNADQFSAQFESVLALAADLTVGIQFLCESGRFLVGNSAVYVTRILYKKKIKNKNILIVDGGMHHFFSATKAGQFIHRSFPIEVLKSANSENIKFETVTICGKTCSEGDVFAYDIELPSLNTGDLLIIGNAGAYSLQYSPVNFIRHNIATEEFIIDKIF